MAQTLLILLLALVLLAPQTYAASRCLGCHTSHYTDRGACTSCHRGNDRTDRKRVAHDRLVRGRYAWVKVPGAPAVTNGKRLVDSLACRRCHTIGRKGNRLAANLDEVSSARHPEELAAAIRSPVNYMPDFALDDAAVSEVVNALLSSSAPPPKDESPLVVHFSRVPTQEDVFGRKCGTCHRMLTGRKGGLGSGSVGPNLSGLLRSFYPANFGRGEKWTAERLKRWVANPREFRVNTTMRPVTLNRDEWIAVRQLMEEPSAK